MPQIASAMSHYLSLIDPVCLCNEDSEWPAFYLTLISAWKVCWVTKHLCVCACVLVCDISLPDSGICLSEGPFYIV